MTDREPFAYKNWVNSKNSSTPSEIYEYPLFTDAQITGELTDGLGPYKLLNAVRIGQYSRPSIVLRVEWHLTLEELTLTQPDDSMYHGGVLPDEIAALIALCLGIRVKAGGEIRSFKLHDDPLGRPVSYSYQPDPILPILSHAEHKEPIHTLQAEQSLDKAKRLHTFIRLIPKDAVALVRAARLYQEAVWISGTAPELSWLMLTSAVEVIANSWRETSEEPIERLRAWKPELETLLLTKGDELFVRSVAEMIVKNLGATKKFTDFLIKFLPPPPTERPERFKCPWEKPAMKKALNKIYDHRSNALHGGIPFPSPMCHPGDIIGKSKIPTEIPWGQVAGSRGGSWTAKNMPMLLHIYEYIVRNAILNWWEQTLPKEDLQL